MTISQPREMRAAHPASSARIGPSSSSTSCVFHITPPSFSPQQAAADHRTILSFLASSSLKSSPKTSPSLPSSTASCPPFICRICRTEESDASFLLSPCLCSGSLAHVHSACLLRWIDSRPAADPQAGSSTTAVANSSFSLLSSPSLVEPVSASAHVCELCQSPYRICYTYTAKPMTCNSALLHLTLDSFLVALLIALSLLLTLSLPADTSPAVWWTSVVSFTLLGLVSLGFALRRYYYKNASVTLVAAEGERQQRSIQILMSEVVPEHRVAMGVVRKAAGDEYVRLECEQVRLDVG